jgi:beta-galactosidase
MAVDEKGLRYTWGSRQAYCPNSPIYRLGAAAMTRMLAEHYAAHPALAMWHVNNEYACHVQRCYCDICAAEIPCLVGEALRASWTG